jgi:hypothetical protein
MADRAVSEHGLTDFFADMLEGEPFYGEGYQNPYAPENPDYVIMPSGYAIPTDYCKYTFSNAYKYGWAKQAGVSSEEYLLRNCAYGEQWVVDGWDHKSYDPRTGKVDTLEEGGGTGLPSPSLYPYYTY